MGLVETISDAGEAKPFAWPALERVSPDYVALMRKCGGQPRIWTETHGDRILRVTGPTDVPVEDLVMRCVLAFGNGELVVRTNEHALAALLRSQDVDLDPGALSPASAALVIEALVCDLTEPLEGVLGGPLQVRDHARAAQAERGPFFGVTIHSGGADRVDLAVFGPIAALNRIVDAIGDRGRARRRDEPFDIPFRARFFAPDVKLTAEQFQALEKGGGLMLDQPWDRRRAGWLSLQDHLFATVDHHEEGIKMTSSLVKPAEETPPAAPPRRPGADPRLAEGLPVTISVQLAERRMPLQEVQRLSSGDVIKLEEIAATDVALLANGAPFADGELVELDGKVAVRIKRLG